MSHCEDKSATDTVAVEMDVQLCTLHRAATQICTEIDRYWQAGPGYDIEIFETQAKHISTLRSLHSELQALTALVGKNGAAAEQRHTDEIKAAQDAFSRMHLCVKRPDPPRNQMTVGDLFSGPTIVERPTGIKTATLVADIEGDFAEPTGDDEGAAGSFAKSTGVAKLSGIAKLSGADGWIKQKKRPQVLKLAQPQALKPAQAQVTRQLITLQGAVGIDAQIIPATLSTTAEIFAAVKSGDIHYIPQWNHFALRIGECVLHANIGRVYGGASRSAVPRDMPERVKECTRRNCGGTTEGCNFYHDPELHPGSTDVRNFVSESWLYCPAVVPARYGSRRIGSIVSLESDLELMSLDDSRRFIHQATHDILCAVIIWRRQVSLTAKSK